MYVHDIFESLRHCIKYNKIEQFKIIYNVFRDSNVSMNIIDAEHGSLLHKCAYYNNSEIMRFIINENICDINHENYSCETPLHHSVYFNRQECVEVLLEYINDISLKFDADGYDPISWCVCNNRPEILNCFYKAGIDVTKFKYKHKYLIVHGILENCVNEIRVILNNSKLEDIESIMHKNRPLLHISIDIGNIECIKLLLEKGVDVNVKDNDGYNALFGAIYENRLDCVKYLIQQGCDFNNIYDGLSAIEFAKSLNRNKIIEYLKNLL